MTPSSSVSRTDADGPMNPTHLDPDGTPRMVDVGAKPITERRAVAEATVRMDPEVLATLLQAGGPKGEVLTVARLNRVLR